MQQAYKCKSELISHNMDMVWSMCELRERITTLYLEQSRIKNLLAFMTTCKTWNAMLTSQKCFKQMRICVNLAPFIRGETVDGKTTGVDLTFKNLPKIIHEVSRIGFDTSTMQNLSTSISILTESFKIEKPPQISYTRQLNSVLQFFIYLDCGALQTSLFKNIQSYRVDRDYILHVFCAYKNLVKFFELIDKKIEEKLVPEEELQRWSVFCKKRGIRYIHRKATHILKKYFKKNDKFKQTLQAVRTFKETLFV